MYFVQASRTASKWEALVEQFDKKAKARKAEARSAWLVYAWTKAGLTDQPSWIEAVSAEQLQKGAEYYLVDPTVFQITIEYHENHKDS
jgi:hypothetical protein